MLVLNFLLLCLVFLIVDGKTNHTELPEVPTSGKCEPGKVYKDDCNVCSCSSDHKLLCTKMLCRIQRKTEACIPGTNFVDKCNSCFCTHNFRLFCSKKQCNNNNKIKSGEDKVTMMKFEKCDPKQKGTVYRKGCSICTCDAYNHVTCEKKSCVDPIWWRVKDIPTSVLPEYSEAALSKLPELASSTSECKPGVIYKVDCNPCVCLDNGDMTCGQIVCMDAKVPGTRTGEGRSADRNAFLDTSKDDCVPGKTYKKDCNVCRCVEPNQLRCTNKWCPKRTQIQKLMKEFEKLS